MTKKAIITIIILSMFVCNSLAGAKFLRSVQAVSVNYYKILLSLGSCKGSLLFTEEFVWGKLTMHRIFDIYFKSKEVATAVEIELVISNTDVIAYSKYGVDHMEFSASLFLPPRTLAVFYSLKIYSCRPPKPDSDSEIESTTSASESNYYDEYDVYDEEVQEG